MPDSAQLTSFLLLLVRCLAFLGLGPLLGAVQIPTQVKLIIALATAVGLYAIAPSSFTLEGAAATSIVSFALVIGKEVLLGGLLALVCSFTFAGIRMAGELIGIQSGLSFATVVDPHQGQASLLGHVYEMVAISLFVIADGHHLFLRALARSVAEVPPGAFLPLDSLPAALLPMAGAMFLITIEVGAPVLAALFLTDAALGLVARAVPQVNVLILGVQVKLAVAIFLLVVSAPLFAHLLQFYTNRLEGQIGLMLTGM